MIDKFIISPRRYGNNSQIDTIFRWYAEGEHVYRYRVEYIDGSCFVSPPFPTKHQRDFDISWKYGKFSK